MNESKLQLLNIHCANLAMIRMQIEILEAQCTVKGWTSDLVCQWRDYNDTLIKLGMQTKRLLPF